MRMEKRKIRVIKVDDPNGRCAACGAGLSELGSFHFAGETINTVKYRLELNACKNCGKQFLLRYDIFDLNHHVNANIFQNDVNDVTFTWQSLWSAKQLQGIPHLKLPVETRK
jgi:hypothetical protein